MIKNSIMNTKNSFTTTLTFDDPSIAQELFGPLELHLKELSQYSGANFSTKGTELFIEARSSEEQEQLAYLFAKSYESLQRGQSFDSHALIDAYIQLKANSSEKDLFPQANSLITPRKTITARNNSQRKFLELIREKEMIFATGPAGTGKSYLAVAAAVSMLQSKRVKKIILTRPAVEAGEKLGFLPGDMEEKINPYLRPLYDALGDMLGTAQLIAKQESGQIEVAPLAFMRGRTLNEAFLILDEAQNTTREQMKMFLTRMGYGSRAIITGDLTQIDLPPIHVSQLQEGEKKGETRSGLVHALKLLKNIPEIGFIHFKKSDVVRHPLVGQIVDAYDIYDDSQKNYEN